MEPRKLERGCRHLNSKISRGGSEMTNIKTTLEDLERMLQNREISQEEYDRALSNLVFLTEARKRRFKS